MTSPCHRLIPHLDLHIKVGRGSRFFACLLPLKDMETHIVGCKFSIMRSKRGFWRTYNQVLIHIFGPRVEHQNSRGRTNSERKMIHNCIEEYRKLSPIRTWNIICRQNKSKFYPRRTVDIYTLVPHDVAVRPPPCRQQTDHVRVAYLRKVVTKPTQ